MSERPSGSPEEKVLHVESAIHDAVGDPRLHSYLSLHEFEALLYTDPVACGVQLAAPKLQAAMAKAVERCGSPEAVNDGPNTAPSKRIKDAYPKYGKVRDGLALAERIGLPAIRQACPHFGGWLMWLESLGSR